MTQSWESTHIKSNECAKCPTIQGNLIIKLIHRGRSQMQHGRGQTSQGSRHWSCLWSSPRLSPPALPGQKPPVCHPQPAGCISNLLLEEVGRTGMDSQNGTATLPQCAQWGAEKSKDRETGSSKSKGAKAPGTEGTGDMLFHSQKLPLPSAQP